MEPARGAITEHCSRCQGYGMLHRQSASLTASGVALRRRATTQRHRTANPDGQLITLRLWIAPPVTAQHPRARRRRLVLPPMRWVGIGEAWSFTERRSPRRIGHPGLVFRPTRQNSPRPQAMGVGSSASPVEAPPCAGLCRSGAEDMFHERQTQDVVFSDLSVALWNIIATHLREQPLDGLTLGLSHPDSALLAA